MRVVGVTSPTGGSVSAFTVSHGEHPDTTLWNQGYAIVRPLSANLVDQDVLVNFLIRRISKADQPPRHRPRSWDVNVPRDGAPLKRQRLAAYALVSSSRGLLGTQCSPRTNAPGVWMLPGGGVHPGEAPADAVLREVHEETSQRARIEQLLALQSDHWIGYAPDGTLEDFHALRLMYLATCDAPSEPVVLDREGTTEGAAWVDVAQWRKLPWTAGARTLLSQHAAPATY